MTDSEEIYFPDINTGLELSGDAISDVESMLNQNSALDTTGFRKAEEEDLPEDAASPRNPVYIQEYPILHVEGEDHLDFSVNTASVYSVAVTDGHYFIAENGEVSQYLPEVSSEFYQQVR